MRRIRDVLRTRILEGEYGDRPLPSETDLAVEFSASRNVVREVLALLRDEGLVTRIQGCGTFVVSAKAEHGLDRLRGLAETFHAGHPRVANRVLLAERVPAVPLVAERLEIEPGAPVVALERIRLLDGEPVSLDASYLPAEVGEPLLAQDLEHRDVFALIESELGLPLGRARVAIESVAADSTVADLLETRVGSPLLFVERLAYSDLGRPVDLEFLRFRGDRISLSTLLVRRPVRNPFHSEESE
ncbi:GntR family transcriptional regulator [Glycomyces albus]